MCVCVDRYLHIRYALRCSQILSKRMCLVTISAIWIGAFAIFTLHKGADRNYSGNYYYDQNSFICTIDFLQDWIFTLFIISIVVTPAFTIIPFCMFKIYAISKRHVNDINALHRQCYVFTITNFTQFSAKNNIKDHSDITEQGSKDKEIAGTERVDDYPKSDNDNSRIFNKNVSKWRAMKINLITVISFAVAWIPYSIIQVIMDFHGKNSIPPNATFVIMWIAFANSSWNFVVYFIMNRHFRDALYTFGRSLLHKNRVHPL